MKKQDRPDSRRTTLPGRGDKTRVHGIQLRRQQFTKLQRNAVTRAFHSQTYVLRSTSNFRLSFFTIPRWRLYLDSVLLSQTKIRSDWSRNVRIQCSPLYAPMLNFALWILTVQVFLLRKIQKHRCKIYRAPYKIFPSCGISQKGFATLNLHILHKELSILGKYFHVNWNLTFESSNEIQRIQNYQLKFEEPIAIEQSSKSRSKDHQLLYNTHKQHQAH